MNRKDLSTAIEAATQIVTARSGAEVSARTRYVLADTVSVALASGRRPQALALVQGSTLTGTWRHERRSLQSPASLLTASGGCAQPDRAAFVNASILCDLEMDEGVRPTGHPAAHVLPAVLAAGEALGSSLGQVLDSLLVGYEIAAYLLESFRLAEGIHPHGHLGAIGAAAAVAHLRGVDPVPPALVAATTQLVTTWGPCREGASARNTWTGHAAQAGLLANHLAEAGWEGSADVLATAFDGGIALRQETVLPSPASPRILNGYFKFFSGCALTHTSIEAALQLVVLRSDEIEAVQVRTTSNNLKVAARPGPRALSRRFSIPFAVATALTRGSADPRDFDAPDQDTLDLAQRVTVEENPEFTAMWPSAAPAEVVVTLTNGETLRGYCDNARGTAARPVGADELRNKSATLLGDAGATWDTLTTAADSSRIAEVLSAAVSASRVGNPLITF